MKSSKLGRRVVCSSLAFVVAGVVLAGCSKKEDASASTTPAAAPAPPAAQAPDASQADASQAPAVPIPDAAAIADAQAAMAAADAALRQKEYEKAVRTMLAIRQAQLTAQQAEQARQEMYSLQRNLANAIASGDPNAKAAAELLRAGRGH